MSTILFNPLFSPFWVAIVAVVILLGAAWLEVRRNQKLLTLRLFALTLAVFSLVCLTLNPMMSVKKSSDIILLTSGFNKTKLDSLLQRNSESQLYQLQADESLLSKATIISNYRDLGELKGNLTILGEGIPDYILEYVDTSSLHYFPDKLARDFYDINPGRIYTVNQPGKIEGMVNANRTQTVKLTGPGITEDSVVLKGNGLNPFSLEFTPKASGLYVYTVMSTDSSGKKINEEKIPVAVQEQKPLSILFLSNYPSAEIRFLKNYLEEKNHQVTLWYQVSKDKYRTEFINTPQQKINKLNQSMLQNFDLVLTDESAIASFTATELRELKESVKQGLGLITLINSSVPAAQVNNFLDLKITKIKNDSAQLLINRERIKLPATPVQISSERKLFPIHREPTGRIVSGYYTSGLGKSGFQLLTNTYRIQLAGEKELYANLWSVLLETVSRKALKKYDLRFITPFPYYPDEPIQFEIISAAEKPTVKIDSIEIPLTENPFIKNVWHGKIWAKSSGWNSLIIAQDSSQHNFFVSQLGEWRSLRSFNQQKSLQKIATQKKQGVVQFVHQSVPRIIFLILFLLSVGFLWLAPKL